MIRIYVNAILIFLPLAVLQVTIIPFISYRQITPDLILIPLVFYTLRTGQLQGTILGFVYGLLFDIISGGVIGSAMFAKTVSGFITGYFYNENKIEYNITTFVFMYIILLAGSIDSILYSFFSTTEINKSLFILFFEEGLFPGLFTAVLALPIVIFYPKRLFT